MFVCVKMKLLSISCSLHEICANGPFSVIFIYGPDQKVYVHIWERSSVNIYVAEARMRQKVASSRGLARRATVAGRAIPSRA